MEYLTEFIENNAAIISVGSLVIGFSGILLALIIYRISKPKISLAYSARTFRIISDKARAIDSLTVTYRSIDVQTLSITRLAIWNDGNQILRESDLPSIDPPTVEVRKDIELYALSLIEQPTQANQFVLDGNVLKFQNISPNEGAIVEVVHSGTGIYDVFMSGSVIGGKLRKASMVPESIITATDSHGATTIMATESAREQNRFYSNSCFFVSLVALAWSFFDLAPAIFICGGSLVLGLLVRWSTLKSYPPNNLTMFDDNLEQYK